MPKTHLSHRVPLSDSLNDLGGKIRQARDLLNSTHVRSGHLVLQQVLVRYLRNAIAAAEVSHIVAAARHPDGAAPVTRYLFEAAVDLMYLLTEPDPDAAAARTLVWNILDWERHWELHRAVDATDASVATGPQQQETADEAISNFVTQLRELGEDASVVELVYRDAKGRRSWHWSGVTRTEMLRRLEARANPEFSAMLRALWPILSDEAHPSPEWHRLQLEFTEQGSVVVPDPAESEDSEVERFAAQTASLLEIVRRLVELYYEQDRRDYGM